MTGARMPDPQPLELIARVVGVHRAHGVVSVGLAEGTDPQARRLTFQRAVAFDDQDRRDGMDTYCIVAGVQGGTVYGGVVDWKLEGNELELSLTQETARVLGLPPRVKIAMAVDVREIERVAKALRFVLTGLDQPVL